MIGHPFLLEMQADTFSKLQHPTETYNHHNGRRHYYSLYDVYQIHLLHSCLSLITSQAKWNALFPVDPDETVAHWSNIYQAPYKSDCDTKLQAFQFQLLHRFIPCNRFLRNIRIKDDDKCSFCPGQDTIQHFMFEHITA